MPSPVCRQFAFGSPDYQQAVRLREEVLRRPLGLQWTPEDFEAEDGSFHLGGFDGTCLVGTLVLRPLSTTTLKMRQVAVAADYQSQGVGRALVRLAEDLARARGFTEIVAHARQTAMEFYRKLDYEVTGDAFLELGVLHYPIRKSIAPARA